MSEQKWVGIWGNAPSLTEWKPEQYAKNITLTYPICVPFDGSALKLKFSNMYGPETVNIDRFAIVKRAEGRSGYDVLYMCEEPFDMDPGAEHETDEFEVDCREGEKIYVQFYLKQFTNMTSGVYTSGIYSAGLCSEGNFIGKSLPAERTVASNWNYFLTDVFLKTDHTKHTIICFGDSITAQDWPDFMYEKFMADEGNNTAIVRKAVSGTRLTKQYDCNQYRSYGIKGDVRFPREADVDGADIVLVQHGINDIIHPVGVEVNKFRPWSDLPTAQEMIESYRNYIQIAREYGEKVYFGTLLPIEGWRTYEQFREDIRVAVNEWIRTTDEIDGYVDFDAILRDPEDPKKFADGYDSGDHLHPNKIAYKKMGELAYEVLKDK
ncbi:MAG: lipase [Lachnospiraceae bacterium]|nr:lipase [Lachnospiraceae bacterium]